MTRHPHDTEFFVGHAATHGGKPLMCDIDRLIASRLLVQANSGAGKSRTLRRLLEQTHGRVQQIVIDPEGEFSTLRERFDYVLAARSGGDTVADPRSAGLLAEKLLELGVSAVLDLFELKLADRITFVARFLDAMVNADKRLWHPVLVVVDEANIFCPEKGQGSGREEPASATSVIDLCTRGRKRGFCAVLAVQRLSMLNKNAAAECNNKLIGRSSLDVDMTRASKELGFTSREQINSLRTLDAGNFYAFGPAFSERDVTLVHVGDVSTSHPTIGSKRAAIVPPPTAKIAALLPQLADLPAEADAREQSVADLRKTVADLKRENAQLRKAQPAAPKMEIKTVERFVLKDGQLARAEQLLHSIGIHEAWLDEARVKLKEIGHEIAAAIRQAAAPQTPTQTATGESRAAHPAQQPSAGRRLPESDHRPEHADARHGRSGSPATQATSSGSVGAGERKVLTVCGQQPDGASRELIGIMTGYKRSSRNDYISRLSLAGLVTRDGEKVLITEAGRAELGSDFEPLPIGADLQRYWLDRLTGGEREILVAVCGVYPRAMSREQIDEHTGYKRSSRNDFISRLRIRMLITDASDGTVRASDILFD